MNSKRLKRLQISHIQPLLLVPVVEHLIHRRLSHREHLLASNPCRTLEWANVPEHDLHRFLNPNHKNVLVLHLASRRESLNANRTSEIVPLCEIKGNFEATGRYHIKHQQEFHLDDQREVLFGNVVEHVVGGVAQGRRELLIAFAGLDVELCLECAAFVEDGQGFLADEARYKREIRLNVGAGYWS